MTGTDEFFAAAAEGRETSAEAWHAYLEAFHTRLPEANELFTYLRRPNGDTSYSVVAKAIVAASPSAILDAGCGDGNLLEELIERLPQAHIVALDTNIAELNIARTRYGHVKNVQFVEGDLRALPFGDARFDCVASHQVVNLFPDSALALGEIARVLRPGGLLVFAANRSFSQYQTANWQVLNAAGLDALRARYPMFKWPRMGEARAYTEDGLRELFADEALWQPGSVQFFNFKLSALTTPAHVAAMFGRLYVYGTLPERAAILAAVERRAEELAIGEFVDIELPFRVTTVRRA